MTDKTDRVHILDRIGKEEVQSLAQKIWQGENRVNTKIASEALAIIREKYETDPTFFSGKSAKGIAGGLFYLLGQTYDSVRTQRQIAKSLNTTEMTIRASCRDWTEFLQNHHRNIHLSNHR
jgi:transcription initiation factor TFIIIB Brf1 subunit/transcription initiation factor TFIIB